MFFSEKYHGGLWLAIWTPNNRLWLARSHATGRQLVGRTPACRDIVNPMSRRVSCIENQIFFRSTRAPPSTLFRVCALNTFTRLDAGLAGLAVGDGGHRDEQPGVRTDHVWHHRRGYGGSRCELQSTVIRRWVRMFNNCFGWSWEMANLVWVFVTWFIVDSRCFRVAVCASARCRKERYHGCGSRWKCFGSFFTKWVVCCQFSLIRHIFEAPYPSLPAVGRQHVYGYFL